MDNQGLGTLDATGELAEQLERIGTQILNASRAELYFGMRFLDVALSSFDYQMNTGGCTIWNGRKKYLLSSAIIGWNVPKKSNSG